MYVDGLGVGQLGVDTAVGQEQVAVEEVATIVDVTSSSSSFSKGSAGGRLA